MKTKSPPELGDRSTQGHDSHTTYPSGARPYRAVDGPRYDRANGPSHQPGVMPGHDYEPLRTPCGETGAPGAEPERSVGDLDRAANRRPTARAADA